MNAERRGEDEENGTEERWERGGGGGNVICFGLKPRKQKIPATSMSVWSGGRRRKVSDFVNFTPVN